MIMFIVISCTVAVHAAAFGSSVDEQRLYLKAQKILDDWRGNAVLLKEAEEILQELMAKNPDSAFAHVGFGRLAYKKGYINNRNYKEADLIKAHKYFNRALEINPELFDACFYSAYAYIFSRNWQKAGQMAGKAKELDPESPRTGLLMAEIALWQERFKEAAQWANFAISKTTDNKILIDSHRLLTKVYRKQKQYDLAEQSYLKIIELDPDSPWAMSNYSSFLSYFKSEYDRAIEYGRKALELMDFGMGHRVLAKAYYGKGFDFLLNNNQTDVSIDYFKLAIEHYPDYADAYFGLGMAFGLKGTQDRNASLIEKAEYELISAIRFNPDHEQAREQLMKIELFRREMGK